jgi:D-alanyl-D-alanine dipeptidase
MLVADDGTAVRDEPGGQQAQTAIIAGRSPGCLGPYWETFPDHAAAGRRETPGGIARGHASVEVTSARQNCGAGPLPTIRLDVRYAGTDNFMGVPLYSSARAFLQRPAAEALARAHQKLRAQGFGLLIHDGYRPWYVTRMFWEATPDSLRVFVADPSRGSRHNRGCAVDLTLYELATGRPVEMPGVYDEMSPRSYPTYPGATRQRAPGDLPGGDGGGGLRGLRSGVVALTSKDWRSYGSGTRGSRS